MNTYINIARGFDNRVKVGGESKDIERFKKTVNFLLRFVDFSALLFIFSPQIFYIIVNLKKTLNMRQTFIVHTPLWSKSMRVRTSNHPPFTVTEKL